MNITFNRKISLGLMGVIITTAQVLYAQDDNNGLTVLNTQGTVNNGGCFTQDAINIQDDGVLDVGEASGDEKGYFHISGENGMASNITGKLNINKTGLFLNEGKLFINNSDSKSVINNGTIVNQSEITVQANGILNSQENGVILNGFKHNTEEDKTKFYSYDDETLSIVENTTGEAKEGIIRFIPGSKSEGNINGGIVDLTNYISINSDTNDDGSKTIIFDTEYKKIDNTDGQLLKNSLENVEIKLFDTDENNPVKITFDSNGNQKKIFNKFTFKNCFAVIPNSISSEGGYIFKKGSSTLSVTDLTEKETIQYNETTNLNKIDFTEDIINENFDKIKLLFNINDNVAVTDDDSIKNIYHNEYDTTNAEHKGLLLKDSEEKQDANKLSFSELFNKYSDYNCYIRSSIETGKIVNDLVFDITAESYNANPLDLKLNMNNTIKKDLYIQLSGNKNVKISSKYDKQETNESTGEITTTADQNIDNTLQLNLNNPGKNYAGQLSRDLPELSGLRSIETITGKSTTGDIKTWLYDKYATILISEIGTPDDYDSKTNNGEKIILLAKHKLASIKGTTIDNISDDSAYDYLKQRAINDDPDNKTTVANNNKLRTTQIFQNYSGPAFNNYAVSINSADISKTLKSNCETSEVIEYIVNHNCDPSDSNTDTTTKIAFSAGQKPDENGENANPFVIDKLIIGASKDDANITKVETDANTNILTGSLVINRPFVLNGSLRVSSKINKTQFNTSN